jgi:hypothetical protein
MKKWPMAVVAGVTTRDVPIPPRRPKTMRNCQYSGVHSKQKTGCKIGRCSYCHAPVHTPMSMILAIINTLPAKTRTRGPLASKTGPMKMPHRKVRKMYMLKIHPTELVL